MVIHYQDSDGNDRRQTQYAYDLHVMRRSIFILIPFIFLHTFLFLFKFIDGNFINTTIKIINDYTLPKAKLPIILALRLTPILVVLLTANKSNDH